MPNGDRTGPEGMGPRTGRGLGFCNGAQQPGWQTSGGAGFGRGMGRGFGRGFGRGMGMGRRAGWGAVPAGAAVQGDPDVAELKSQVSGLTQLLQRLEEKLEMLGQR